MQNTDTVKQELVTTVKLRSGEEAPLSVAKVEDTVKMVKESDGGPRLESELSKIGVQSLRQATRTRDLMDESIMDNLPELSGDSELSKMLVDANIQTQKLNPNSVTNSFLYKLPLPFVKEWMLKKFTGEIKSERSQVQEVFQNLQIGKEGLIEHMLDLEEQYATLKKTDMELIKDIAFGEAVFKELEAIDGESLSLVEKQKFDMAKNKVSRRVRDLETVRQAISQFFVSINQTMRNQSLLNESIDSLMLIGPMVISNAIRIHAAINEQRQVAEATKQVSDTLSNTMLQNAAAVEMNAQDVAELYKNPVLAMDKMQEAYSKLENAVNITNQAMKDGTQSARDVTLQLRQMTAEFEPVVASLEQNVDSMIEGPAPKSEPARLTIDGSSSSSD